MARLWLAIGVACTLVPLVTGCSGKHDTAHTSERPEGSIHTMADLNKLLRPGLSTNEILSTLGKPSRVENLPTGEAVWRYGLTPFPAEGQMQGTDVIGVQLGITNGHLAYWGCAYGDINQRQGSKTSSIQESSSASSPVRKSPSTLSFFVVSSDPIPGGRSVDTAQLPKLGFVSATPDLAVSKVRDVRVDEQGNGSEKLLTFTVQLTAEDSKRLQALTATNLSKQLLIMVGDQPVCAPTIRTPLESGNFLIECNDENLATRIKEQLAEIKQ